QAGLEVQTARRHRLDSLPRDQPARPGGDRVPPDVHALQALGARGGAELPRHRRGMEGVMATAAERFAAFALELELDAVPEEVVEAAKLHVLDVLGCGLAAHGLGVAGEGRQAMAELGGEPDSSVIGLETGLPAPNA